MKGAVIVFFLKIRLNLKDSLLENKNCQSLNMCIQF